MIKNFKELKVWQKAHILVLQVYKVTQDFPAMEQYCLTSQMRRAAISIAANIVEGKKRNTANDFAHFINMADTSLEELKYYFIKPARKPQAFKPGDEWPPETEPVSTGVVKANLA